jgi:hypothetical protein
VEHHDDFVAQADLIPQRKEILAVFGIRVTVGARVFEFVRISHADQIAGDQPP